MKQVVFRAVVSVFAHSVAIRTDSGTAGVRFGNALGTPREDAGCMDSADASQSKVGQGERKRIVPLGEQAGTRTAMLTGACRQCAEGVPGGGTWGGVQRSALGHGWGERFGISGNAR